MNWSLIIEDCTYYIQGGKAHKKPGYQQQMREVRDMGAVRTDLDELYDESEIL